MPIHIPTPHIYKTVDMTQTTNLLWFQQQGPPPKQQMCCPHVLVTTNSYQQQAHLNRAQAPCRILGDACHACMLQRYWNSERLKLNVEQSSIIHFKISISTGWIQTSKHLPLKPTRIISHARENKWGGALLQLVLSENKKKICLHWAILNFCGKEAHVSQFFSTFPERLFFSVL